MSNTVFASMPPSHHRSPSNLGAQVAEGELRFPFSVTVPTGPCNVT